MGPLWAAAPTRVGHELLLTESLYEDSAQGSGGGGGGGGVRVCRPQATGVTLVRRENQARYGPFHPQNVPLSFLGLTGPQ